MISSNLSPRRRSSRRPAAFFIALLLVVALVYLLRAPLSSLLWSALGPISQWRLGSSSLEAELASTTAMLADRNLLAEENKTLKAMLGRTDDARRILAAVTSRPPQTPYDTLMLDIGAEEGVALGDTVSAGGSTVVGTITDLYPHASRVTLFSASGEKYDAMVQLKSGAAPVSIEGQGGGSLRGQVPTGTDVAVGAPVVLPGIYAGLAASVVAIDRGGESYLTLYLRLPVDPFTLRFVQVIKK